MTLLMFLMSGCNSTLALEIVLSRYLILEKTIVHIVSLRAGFLDVTQRSTALRDIQKTAAMETMVHGLYKDFDSFPVASHNPSLVALGA